MIYADNAATTKMSKTAVDAMMSVITENYGNPSSLYSIGQRAKEILEEARATVADVIGAQPQEILFTSGGSEADNQAILSAAALGRKNGKMHIVSTAFEHHAVLHTLEKLKKEGFEITLMDVHEDGLVRPEELEKALREDTCLVTVMFANNEIGTVQPIREIGEICRKHGVLFHTDAVQAVGLGQHKRHPEFPVVIRESCYTSRKTTWFPVIARCSPVPLQRLRRSPTLGIGVRNGTCHP